MGWCVVGQTASADCGTGCPVLVVADPADIPRAGGSSGQRSGRLVDDAELFAEHLDRTVGEQEPVDTEEIDIGFVLQPATHRSPPHCVGDTDCYFLVGKLAREGVEEPGTMGEVAGFEQADDHRQ